MKHCEFTKTRLQMFFLGGSDETNDNSETLFIGLDPKDNNILSRDGVTLANNVNFLIQIGAIKTGNLTKNTTALRLEWDIDRVSGKIRRVGTFSKMEKQQP